MTGEVMNWPFWASPTRAAELRSRKIFAPDLASRQAGMGRRTSPAYPGASLAAADRPQAVAAIHSGGKLLSTTDDAPAHVAQTVALIADPAPARARRVRADHVPAVIVNAGWAKSSTGSDWLGYAFAYGGLVQLLAGMWEFKNRNVFGATAFSTLRRVLDRPGAVGRPGRPARAERDGREQGPGLDPARLRDLQHLHDDLQHAGERGRVHGVPDPGADRDIPVHRGPRGQCQHHQDRRLSSASSRPWRPGTPPPRA